MAERAGRPRATSAALLLAAVLAASAASTCFCAAPSDHRGPTSFASRRSRFLAATSATARKTACRAGSNPASGATAGTGGHRFRCCGGACTDVLASGSHCGACGNRCAFGRTCCAGRCVAVAHDAGNCGACGRACAAGVPCTYGMCGYA